MPEEPLTLKLDAATLTALQQTAQERGSSPEALVVGWIRERLAHEAATPARIATHRSRP
jgi:hypothetical protein